MKPLRFDEVNVVLGENQPEYMPLPAAVVGDKVVTCWELSEEEKAQVMKEGKIWLATLTFGQPFQPTLMSVDKDDVL